MTSVYSTCLSTALGMHKTMRPRRLAALAESRPQCLTRSSELSSRMSIPRSQRIPSNALVGSFHSVLRYFQSWGGFA
eukprot:3560316-Pyramimonas_sp.AAC.1